MSRHFHPPFRGIPSLPGEIAYDPSVWPTYKPETDRLRSPRSSLEPCRLLATWKVAYRRRRRWVRSSSRRPCRGGRRGRPSPRGSRRCSSAASCSSSGRAVRGAASCWSSYCEKGCCRWDYFCSDQLPSVPIRLFPESLGYGVHPSSSLEWWSGYKPTSTGSCSAGASYLGTPRPPFIRQEHRSR